MDNLKQNLSLSPDRRLDTKRLQYEADLYFDRLSSCLLALEKLDLLIEKPSQRSPGGLHLE